MEVKSELKISQLTPVWESWCAIPSRSHTRRSPKHQQRVRVLPGNPSLPFRSLMKFLDHPMNGGVGGTRLGIDLSLRSNEVRKLFYKGGFTGVLLRENIDPEEFLQEVYRGLLARNNGTCPWDVKKSSFGHYVHIVIRCVLSNYLRRVRLIASRESVTDNGELPIGGLFSQQDGVELRDILEGVFGTGDDLDKVQAFVSALYAGRSRKDALSIVGMPDQWGLAVLTDLKTALIDG